MHSFRALKKESCPNHQILVALKHVWAVAWGLAAQSVRRRLHMCSAGPVLGQRAQPGAVSAEGLASPPRPTPGPRALLRILLPLEPRAPRKPVRPPSPVNSHPAVLCGHSLALTHRITTCCFFLCLRASRRGAPRDGHWCVLHEPGGVLRARVSVQVNSSRDRSTGTAASVGWWRAPGPAGSSFCCAFSGTEPSGRPGRGAGPGSPSPPRPWCWLRGTPGTVWGPLPWT